MTVFSCAYRGRSNFQADVENLGRAFAPKFGLSHLVPVYYRNKILIYPSAMLTLTSVHACLHIVISGPGRYVSSVKIHLDESLA